MHYFTSRYLTLSYLNSYGSLGSSACTLHFRTNRKTKAAPSKVTTVHIVTSFLNKEKRSVLVPQLQLGFVFLMGRFDS
jgi:hypothetical protein